MKTIEIETIHESLVNGQRRQMAGQIDQYGLYDFWDHYRCYLAGVYIEPTAILEYFTDAAISYHRIKNR